MRTRGLETQLHNFYGASESSCTIYTVPQEGIDLEIFPSKAQSSFRILFRISKGTLWPAAATFLCLCDAGGAKFK